jgi:hypothetical protein
MDHLIPAQALKAANAKLHVDAVDEAQSEEDGPVEAEPSPKHTLAWLRWRLAQEPDFKNEENMVTQEIHKRGHTCMFLQKFHCDLKWAENHWGRSKPFVRGICDGSWMAMRQGTWLSFGQGNIPHGLYQRFTRKTREIIRMYEAGIDGPFATHCRRLFNQHRLPFHDAASLAKWEPDSVATATKMNKIGKLLKRKLSCRLATVDHGSHTCCIKFMDGSERVDVPLTELGRVADNETIRR